MTRLYAARVRPLIPRVRVETERLLMVSACALGEASTAADLFSAYAAHRELSSSRRGAARALVGRCTGQGPAWGPAVPSWRASAPPEAAYDGGPRREVERGDGGD